ncbi:DUF397 domain-containing protein [Actinomadura parmotrematis]|uniref:DUF397 domain-containing protein n=1 Tax=Actinomadura parmotrematis TaxID=2864039 RepID=A0ABS7FZ94_9ACTN|nr:DUF397 domain-containing protein [Actinomadura parmotrematis]MBW8485774.1 DUF397 domain-containing protein [Actinomadura parmotrematis]
MSDAPRWRKSSKSNTTGTGDCVELARLPLGIGVRDSKAPSAGHLVLTPTALVALAEHLKNT